MLHVLQTRFHLCTSLINIYDAKKIKVLKGLRNSIDGKNLSLSASLYVVNVSLFFAVSQLSLYHFTLSIT